MFLLWSVLLCLFSKVLYVINEDFTTCTHVLMLAQAHTLDHPLCLGYSVFIMFWSSVMIAKWRQESSLLAYRYNNDLRYIHSWILRYVVCYFVNIVIDGVFLGLKLKMSLRDQNTKVQRNTNDRFLDRRTWIMRWHLVSYYSLLSVYSSHRLNAISHRGFWGIIILWTIFKVYLNNPSSRYVLNGTFL